MIFARNIDVKDWRGEDYAAVMVDIHVNGNVYPFKFDTGAMLTTISMDVAASLGIDYSHGLRTTLSTMSGDCECRLVKVEFQFPDWMDGNPGKLAESNWLVVTGNKKVKRRALLGFLDVHRHFLIESYGNLMLFKDNSLLADEP